LHPSPIHLLSLSSHQLQNLQFFPQDLSLSLRQSFQTLSPSFAASSADFLNIYCPNTNTAPSTFVPYKGAVVINGILYCPCHLIGSHQTPLVPTGIDLQPISFSKKSLQAVKKPAKPKPANLEPTKPEFAKTQTGKPSPPQIQKRYPLAQVLTMAPPNFGALGATFTVVRAMQAISLISIIGMTANFVAEMVSANQSPPHVLIGTLSVVSLQNTSFICDAA
jgi:hypothetical protein